MKDSFRRVDYSIRPAKYAERKMLAEIFRRMAHFEPINRYRYVGFGSVWFSDFLLFHRLLGVKNMLSIEQSTKSKDRFEANKPFNFDIDFRSSTLVLPEMDYTQRQFIWLDYDDPISTDMLRDVASIAMRARSGTALAVSVQCHRAPEIIVAEEERQRDSNAPSAEERFATRFKDYNIDPQITAADLGGWAFGELSRKMLLDSILNTLEIRKLANPNDEVLLKQVCNLEYEDGAKMTTIVVVFYSPNESELLESCQFDELDFLEDDGSAVYIPTPKLTVKEFRLLEKQLPLSGGAQLNVGSIPPGEAQCFIKMYRYFPNFVVVET